jgi:hypothetical protein
MRLVEREGKERMLVVVLLVVLLYAAARTGRHDAEREQFVRAWASATRRCH